MKRLGTAAVLIPLILSVFVFGFFCMMPRSDLPEAYAADEEPAAVKDISECTAELAESVYPYEGIPVTPNSDLTVTYGDRLLERGKDYYVSFKDFMLPGFASVTVKGKGSYTGSTEIGYVIAPGRAEITSLTSYSGGIRAEWDKEDYAQGYQIIYSRTADFKEYHSTTVKDPERTHVNLTSVPKPGETWFVKVRAFFTEDGSFTSKRYGVYSEAKAIKTSREVSKVTIPYIAYDYTGKAVKPTVKVWDELGKKIPEGFYSVKYSENKASGIARITVKGRNGVKGSFVKEFYIRPPKNSITSLVSYKKGFSLSWSAAPEGTAGYQVLYSKDPAFKKDVHSYTSVDIGDLTENFTRVPVMGETWYVKVRSFVSKDGTPNSTRYGYYSKAKSVSTVLYMLTVTRNAGLYPTAHYSPTPLGTVASGTAVGVLEINGLWYKIMYGGRAYWVYGKAFGRSSGVTQTALNADNVEAYADDILFETGCSTKSIFSYVCCHVHYSSGWDNTSRNFKAARALRYGYGPCYYSAATADLFLDRAGYEHQIMRGIQHGDVHNWNAYVKNGATMYMETTEATYRLRFYDKDYSYIISCGFRWNS